MCLPEISIKVTFLTNDSHNRYEVAVQILAYQKVLKNSTSYVFARYSSNPFFIECGQRTCHVSDNGNLLNFFFVLET